MPEVFLKYKKNNIKSRFSGNGFYTEQIPHVLREGFAYYTVNYLTIVISEPNHFVEISPSLPSAFISLSVF